MIWCPPPRHSWHKLSLLLISLQRVEKERKGQTVEKPRKWKFLYSLFKTTHHPKPSELAYTSPAGSPVSPQRPNGPPRLCAAGPGDALLQPHVLPGLWAACESRQSGKLHTLESDGESAHCVLSEGQDWLQIASDPGAWDQAWEDRSHSCCAGVAPADLPALQHHGLFCRSGREPPGQIPCGTWSAAGGPGHVTEGKKDTGTVTSREWELQIGCEVLLPANQCVSQRERIQPLCLGGCQRGNQKVLGLCQQAHRKTQEIKKTLNMKTVHLVN